MTRESVTELSWDVGFGYHSKLPSVVTHHFRVVLPRTDHFDVEELDHFKSPVLGALFGRGSDVVDHDQLLQAIGGFLQQQAAFLVVLAYDDADVG